MFTRCLMTMSLLFVFIGNSAEGSAPYITSPPKGWECITDPSQLPAKVHSVYIGSCSKQNAFAPSLNITREETSLAKEEYVTLAKTYHESQGKTRCTRVGQLKTGSGMVEVLQIDRPSQWGDVRFVQAILLHGGEAYVVTATCLKNEFHLYSSQIFKAIQSLNVAE